MRVVVAAAISSLVEAMQTQLSREHLEVQVVAGGRVLQSLPANAADLIVLHVRSGRPEDLEPIRRLRASGNTTPLMIVSESDALDDHVAGLDAGADEWMSLLFDASEFRARVRALLRRRGSRVVNVLTYAGLTYDTVNLVARVHGTPVELSLREGSLLRIFLLSFNTVVTRERILDEFYGLGESAASNAIEVYVSRLRRKLRGSGLTIRAVHGRGYAISEQEEVS